MKKTLSFLLALCLIFSFMSTQASADLINPTTLAAPSFTIEQLSSGAIRISWMHVAGAVGYQVSKNVSAARGFTLPTIYDLTWEWGASPKTEYIDSAPHVNGNTYVYSVMADGAFTTRDSDWAATKSIVYNASLVKLPSNPTNVEAVYQTDGTVKITWLDHATNESGFDINVEQDGAGTYYHVEGADTNTYIDLGPITKGLTYHYSVRATNAAGFSYWSPIISFSVKDESKSIPAMPSSIVAIQQEDGTILVNWIDNSNNETGFELLESEGSAGGTVDIPANTTSFIVKDLNTVGTTYTFTIRSVNANGVSPYIYEKATVVYAAVAPKLPVVTMLFDGTQSDWAESDLQKAFDNELTYAAITNKYTQKITREEFCTIVVKLYEKLSGVKATFQSNPFSDTTNPEVLKAYNLGIVKGTSKVLFSPNALITRQEVCVMILNCLKLVDPNLNIATSGNLPFTDASNIPSWAKDSVNFCYDKGIIKGVGVGTIVPKNPTTREQGIILLLRTFDQFK